MLGPMSAQPLPYEGVRSLHLASFPSYRSLVVPRAVDCAALSRQLRPVDRSSDSAWMTQREIDELSSVPLAPLPLEKFVIREQTSNVTAEVLNGQILPFEISFHPRAATPVAREMLSRLTSDWRQYVKAAAKRQLARLVCLPGPTLDLLAGSHVASEAPRALERLSELRRALVEIAMLDETYVRSAVEAALAYANGDLTSRSDDGDGRDGDASYSRELLAHRLCVAGGREPKMWLELLIQLFTSSTPEETLKQLNPWLSDADAAKVVDLTGTLLLKCNRVSQARRCVTLVDDLCAMVLSRAKAANIPRSRSPEQAEAISRSARTEMSVRADALAAALAAQRKYVLGSAGGTTQSDVQTCDPRFLVFEFVSTFLLRGAQVCSGLHFLCSPCRKLSLVGRL